MVRIVIEIEENQKILHQITVEVESEEEVNIESCIEEWLDKAVGWAKTWLRYPNTKVVVRNKEI